MSAYFIWVNSHGRKSLTDKISSDIFLKACGQIEKKLINHKCEQDKDIPSHIREYIKDCMSKSYHNIVRRKAWWNGVYEECYNSEYNWNKAKEFVDTFYKPIASDDELSTEVVSKIVKKIDENHQLTNMFEYCIRCYLLQHTGLTRRSSPDGRDISLC